MISRLERFGGDAAGETRANRHTAAEAFCQRHDIGNDAVLLIRE